MMIKFTDPYYQEMFEEKAGKYLELMSLEEADRRAYNEVVKQQEEEL